MAQELCLSIALPIPMLDEPTQSYPYARGKESIAMLRTLPISP